LPTSGEATIVALQEMRVASLGYFRQDAAASEIGSFMAERFAPGQSARAR